MLEQIKPVAYNRMIAITFTAFREGFEIRYLFVFVYIVTGNSLPTTRDKVNHNRGIQIREKQVS